MVCKTNKKFKKVMRILSYAGFMIFSSFQCLCVCIGCPTLPVLSFVGWLVGQLNANHGCHSKTSYWLPSVCRLVGRFTTVGRCMAVVASVVSKLSNSINVSDIQKASYNYHLSNCVCVCVCSSLHTSGVILLSLSLFRCINTGNSPTERWCWCLCATNGV